MNPTPPSPSFGHSVIQDWGKRISPHKDRRETFVGNAGILQFFGNNDLATTVYVSRRLDSSKRVSGKPGAIHSNVCAEPMGRFSDRPMKSMC